MEENPPYVSSPGKIPILFAKIKEAQVPPKFNKDFMATMLDLKSSNFIAMIPFLKRIGFIDDGNVPTQDYKDFRDNTLSGAVMAKVIKRSYSKLFGANEFAYKLGRSDLISKIKTITGLADDNSVLSQIAGTFTELAKLADFGAEDKMRIEVYKKPEKEEQVSDRTAASLKLGISYTINLNLPATTEIAVFDAIFKSPKENLLHD